MKGRVTYSEAFRREVDERHVEELVRAERKIQPRLGGTFKVV